jgi:hypothetical protein
MRLYETTDALKETLLFRPLTWLLVVVATLVAAWKFRATPAGNYAVAMSASGLAYVATFLPVGVASDYRYVYWVVAAGLTSAVMIALAWQTNRSGAPRPFCRTYPRETAKRLELKGPSGSPV